MGTDPTGTTDPVELEKWVKAHPVDAACELDRLRREVRLLKQMVEMSGP